MSDAALLPRTHVRPATDEKLRDPELPGCHCAVERGGQAGDGLVSRDGVDELRTHSQQIPDRGRISGFYSGDDLVEGVHIPQILYRTPALKTNPPDVVFIRGV